MKPQPLPKSIKPAVWQAWPTLDELRAKRPDLKLHKLRMLLREVTCYRCPDQTARYVQEELDELIEDEEAFADAVKAETDAEGRATPQLYDSMVLFRESMRATGELLKSLSELRKMICDISEAAIAPQKLGLELVKDNVELMRARLQHYEENADRDVQLREMMQSTQLDRDLKADAAKGTQKVREQAASLAMAYLPTMLAELQATATKGAKDPKAVACAAALESLEPEVLDSIVESDTHTPEQRAAFTRAREMIKQSKNGQANQHAQSHGAS